MDSAGYIDIAGHPTWVVQRHAAGAPILLLHGGLGDSDELLVPIGPALLQHHALIAFDRRGHGRTADTGAPFHYADMAEETIAVLGHLGIGRIDIVGWSDGGIIALLLALQRPDLVGKAVAIGANYHHAGFAVSSVPPDSPFLGPGAAAHGPPSSGGDASFPSVVDRVKHMWATEPSLEPADLQRITAPVLVMAGDRDLIPLAHTAAMFAALPAAELAIVPGTTHGLIAEKPDLVARLILDFIGR